MEKNMHNLENALVFCAAVWAFVELIRHFVPDYYTKTTNKWDTAIHKRLAEVETKIEEITKKD
jgi:hypothetical protein